MSKTSNIKKPNIILKHFIKNLLTYLSVISTILWILSKNTFPNIFTNPYLAGQLAGIIGITALAWNFILAARLKSIDKLFGGLDKVFKQHRFSGSIAFMFMLAHPLLFIISALPSWQAAKFYIVPNTNNIANTSGILALWLFVLLLGITFLNKLPYHIWKKTHQFLGLPYLLVTIHVLTIDSDITRYLPLQIWIFGLVSISIIAYIYKLFLYRYFGPKYNYTVSNIKKTSSIIELELTTTDKKIKHLPGQFVFIKILDKNIGKEEHPYSISSAPESNALRISIKKLGDWSKNIGKIKKETKVLVYGPYGRFSEKLFLQKKNALFIAGGIGITPFLSMINAYETTKSDQKIDMIYSVKNKNEAFYYDELKKISNHNKNISLDIHYSDNEGYLKVKEINNDIKDLKERLIFICGPRPMMIALTKAFTNMGIPKKNIIFEDFSLK